MLVTFTAALLFGLSLAPDPSLSGPPSGSDRIDVVLRDQLAAAGRATFWVDLRERADLSRAALIADRDDRGTFVMDALRTTADGSQAGLLAMLAARGVDARPFWISNTIRVTGDAELAAELAARPEVVRLRAGRSYRLAPVELGPPGDRVGTVEWGSERIGADDVWADFGVRGQGIVVANIDTGVLYTHPALVKQYRGRKAGGGYNHDYDWWDPSNVCMPAGTPCDNNGHGTHTMGVMVGDDRVGNQIGVAPKARWITAKGCEGASCSDVALLSSGQWILAPTRLDGTGPRPALRPHVVNNSWGGAGGDPWFRDVVEAWVAAEIFPQFPLGSSGPSCGTGGSPGDYSESYATTAFDINNVIASFASRGPSDFGGEIKPDIAAPGVSIRSSWNNNGYLILTGTSMASPHVAGSVALVWSAAPDLRRDVGGTRSILDQSAIDTAGPCGGGASDNNTWGQGRLDAYAAVQLATGAK